MNKKLIQAQKNEITECRIYNLLAERADNKKDEEILKKIAGHEKEHYEMLKEVTEKTIKPSRLKIYGYLFLSKILGLNFVLRLMESGEKLAQDIYSSLEERPEIQKIMEDEQKHEEELIKMIDKQSLEYTSSIVLGLNDALVELTGALAGLTLALQDSRLIGFVGLITGIAASMSMAGSEYLSTQEEEEGIKNPVQAGLITGLSYIGAVMLLVLPYFLFQNPIISLAGTLLIAILIITAYSFYTATIKEESMVDKFKEMAMISLGVAVINFFIGYAIRTYFGIEV